MREGRRDTTRAFATRAFALYRSSILICITALIAAFSMLLTCSRAAAQDGGWELPAGRIVHSAAVSADGQAAVVGSREGIVYRLDGAGKELWRYDAKGTVLGLGISQDGKRVIAASEGRKAIFLDEAGKLLWEKEYDFSLIAAAIAGDGNLMGLVPRKSREVWLLDAAGNDVWKVEYDSAPVSIAISADGQCVAIGTRDAYVQLYDKAGTLLWKQQLDGPVFSLAMSADGAFIAAGDESKKAYLLKGQIDAGAKSSIVWTYKTDASVQAVAITGDGSVVAVGSRDKNVYLFDATGKLTSKYATGGSVPAVALSADGTTLIAGSEDGKAYGFSVKQSVAGYAASQQRGTVLAIVIPLAMLVVIAGSVLFLRLNPAGQRFWDKRGAGLRRLAREIWRARISYLLIFPTIALLFIFNYYPAFSGLFHSFTDWKPGVSEEWVGLKNFEAVFNNEFLRSGIVNAIVLIVTGYIKVLTVPLLVAELLFHMRSTRMQYWLRSLFIFPIVVPGVAIILIWRNIFDPNIGLLNNFLALLGLMHMQQPQAWLGDPNTAIWSIVFIGFPFVGAFALLLYYGGLISIPVELFDAAKVDGAGGLRRFINLDLPLLMGQIKLLLILGFIGGMQEFSLVFLTTEGGPYNATYTPALELYYQAMRFSNFGVASAIGTVLFVVILGGTILNLRMRSAAEYQA